MRPRLAVYNLSSADDHYYFPACFHGDPLKHENPQLDALFHASGLRTNLILKVEQERNNCS
jgi:hypothetical protein